MQILKDGKSVNRFGRERIFKLPPMSFESMLSLLQSKKYTPQNAVIKSDIKHIMRAGVNHKIQSLAAEIIKTSLVNLHKEIIYSYDCKIVGTIHDEILFECNKLEVDIVIPIINKIMSLTSREFVPEIDIPVDISVGINWAMENE